MYIHKNIKIKHPKASLKVTLYFNDEVTVNTAKHIFIYIVCPNFHEIISTGDPCHGSGLVYPVSMINGVEGSTDPCLGKGGK